MSKRKPTKPAAGAPAPTALQPPPPPMILTLVLDRQTGRLALADNITGERDLRALQQALTHLQGELSANLERLAEARGREAAAKAAASATEKPADN